MMFVTLTLLGDIVRCHSTLPIRLHFSWYCPLWQTAALGCNGGFWSCFRIFESRSNNNWSFTFDQGTHDTVFVHGFVTLTLFFFSFSQAISLFNANHHDEAMRRVQDFAQHSDALSCSIIIVSFMSAWPHEFLTLEHTVSHIYAWSLQRLLLKTSGTAKPLIDSTIVFPV